MNHGGDREEKARGIWSLFLTENVGDHACGPRHEHRDTPEDWRKTKCHGHDKEEYPSE